MRRRRRGSGDRGTTTAPAKRGGTIRVAMIEPGGAIDPVLGFDFGSSASGQLVAEYLAWVEPDRTIRPVLATRWEPADETGKEWTYFLQEGVTFSDGRPLTADDVVATFDRLTSKDVADADFTGILSQGSTEKVDDLTVTFHLDRPFVDFPALVAVSNYNAVILPADWPGDFEKNPIGTGPFRLTNIVAKQSVTFEKNADYWQKGFPYLEGVEFRFFAENQPQVLALQGGEVDLMIETPFQGSQALFQDSNVEILSATSSSYRALHMRVDEEPWTDKRVRQALALTLDRQQLVEALFQGKADIGNDHIFAPAFGLELDVPERTQDYDMAKQLLSDAGHPDGIRATLTTENYLEIPQLVTVIKEMAKPAGIEITLEIQDQGKYYGSGDNQPWLQVPLGLVDWGNRPVPSQHINVAYICDGVWNSAHWCSEEYDKLALELDATLDEANRREIATNMATIQQDETPVIIPYWIQRLRAVRTNVQGVKADASGNLELTKASLA
jgi:peptide/nickel transport system substrate-binding protein